MRHSPTTAFTGRILSILLLGLLALPLQAAPPANTYTPAELDALLAPGKTAFLPELKNQAAGSRLDILAAKTVGDPRVEVALRDALLELPLPLDADLREKVSALQGRDGAVYVWMEHEGLPDRPTLAIDAAATATWVMKQDAVHREAAALALQGEAATSASAAAWRLLPQKSALDEASLGKLLLDRLADGEPTEAALADISIFTADHQLAADMLASGKASRSAPLLDDLLAALPGAERELLAAARSNPQLAPTAISQLASVSDRSWAREILLRELSDPVLGTSAASALGKSADDATLAELQQRMLRGGADANAAALALHLSASPYAGHLLAEYLETAPDSPLAAQVKEWLK